MIAEGLPGLEIDADPDGEPCIALEPLVGSRHGGERSSSPSAEIDRRLTRREADVALGAALAALLAAGCGASDAPTTRSARRLRVSRTKPVRLGGPLDFVAWTATGGALKIQLGRQLR